MTRKNKPYKQLYRSCKNRMIAGVCAGLAHYFECDPTWIRLIFVLFLFLGGSAFLIYLVLWFLMPVNPKI
ncbi:MAG: PspC domain-containing protein [Gammaproteobacteria bacterium]|nr:PspC domain-containing protein [Gammaproteobacteria bacterium]